MKLLDILKENDLTPAISAVNKTLDNIDPNMHYADFAKLVAEILKDQYGSHNVVPFMKELHSHLKIKNERNR